MKKIETDDLEDLEVGGGKMAHFFVNKEELKKKLEDYHSKT